MRRPWMPVVAVGLVVVAARAAPTAADTISGVRGESLRLERAQLEARLVDGAIHAQVRYELVNPGPAADAARVELALPAGAVVTGLRYRQGDRVIDGRLVAADAAATRYQAFAASPFVAARGVALLTDDGYHRELALSYLPARARVPIEYELVAPACFAHGRWIAQVPLIEPRPRVRVVGGRVVTAAGVARALGAPLAEACAGFELGRHGADDDRYLVFEAAARRGESSSLVTITAGATVVTELTVTIGHELAAAPRAAAVVFVVDASRSIGDDGVAAQLAVIRGYLAQVPDARFDVVVVRRHASRLFGELVPAAAAAARLAALTPTALAVGNGSNLELGLGLAAEVLAGAPGPRRLVAFTDDQTRTGLDAAALLAALAPLPADAIVHLAIPTPGVGSAWARNFEHRFAEVVGRWGGVVAELEVGPAPSPFVELVRPIQIEAVTVDGPGDRHEDLEPIGEDTGLRRLITGAAAPTVTGWIWGRRWQPTRVTSRAAVTRGARLALGEIGDALDDQAVLALAALGTAVTRVTSLLADDPTWPPGGLPDDEFGMSGSSMCGGPSSMSGVGTYGTLGYGTGTGTGTVAVEPELAPLIAARVAACAAPVAAGTWSTTVTIETTGIEVVDVVVATDAPAVAGGLRARIDACLVEAGWDLELDGRFARYTRTFSATFAR